jgi:hypothetical protein
MRLRRFSIPLTEKPSVAQNSFGDFTPLPSSDMRDDIELRMFFSRFSRRAIWRYRKLAINGLHQFRLRPLCWRNRLSRKKLIFRDRQQCVHWGYVGVAHHYGCKLIFWDQHPLCRPRRSATIRRHITNRVFPRNGGFSQFHYAHQLQRQLHIHSGHSFDRACQSVFGADDGNTE